MGIRYHLDRQLVVCKLSSSHVTCLALNKEGESEDFGPSDNLPAGTSDVHCMKELPYAKGTELLTHLMAVGSGVKYKR